MPSFVTSSVRVLRRLLPPLLGLAALVLIIAWMSGWFRAKIPPGEEPGAVRTQDRAWVLAETLRTTETVDAVGTVEPRTKTLVASQLLAVILDIKVNAGELVQADQLLATLDDRELTTQKREVEAAVAGALADLTMRERDFTRYQMMYAGKAVTKEELDRVEGAYRVAQAQLRRAREQVSRVEVLLTHTQIKAPSAGVITRRFADPGDLAAPGKQLLALHDPNQLDLQASVREALAGTIRIGSKLPVHIDAVSLDLEGQVREIMPQAQEASRSVLIKISLPADKAKNLYAGMFGRAALPVGDAERIVVPAAAVRIVGQLELLDVAGPDGGGVRRFVRTGRRIGGQIEILSGLRGGEKVFVPAGTSFVPATDKPQTRP